MTLPSETIQNIGGRIYTNAEGVLISDVDLGKLQPEWFAVAEEFISLVLNVFQNKVHSIYLRGSVANGSAIKQVSDIDFCIVIFNQLSNDEKAEIQKLGNTLNEKNSFITRFDIGFYIATEITQLKERVLLKLRSICMYGETLAPQIQDIYPGKDVCVTLLGLEREIMQVQDEIVRGVYTSENVSATCKWMAKRVVRSGLELVSKRAGCYTRDLYPCWETFSQYYPQHRASMYRVLELAINPSAKIEDLEYILELGVVVCNLAKMDTDFLV